jgi:hypothetical protein
VERSVSEREREACIQHLVTPTISCVRAVPEVGGEGRPTWAPISQGPHSLLTGLKNYCTLLVKIFSVDDSFDFKENNLTSELRILQMTLPDRSISAMEIFEFVRRMDCYPNFLLIGYYLLYQ